MLNKLFFYLLAVTQTVMSLSFVVFALYYVWIGATTRTDLILMIILGVLSFASYGLLLWEKFSELIKY